MKNEEKSIVWVTENYVDVDFPIIRELKEQYQIMWLISHHERSSFFSDFEYNQMKKELGIEIVIYKTKYRNRNILNILHYYRIVKAAKKFKADVLYLNILGFPYFHVIRHFCFSHKRIIYAAHDVIEHSGLKYRSLIQVYKKFVFSSLSLFHNFSESQEKILHRNYKGKQSFVGRLCLKDYGIIDHKIKDIKVGKKVGFLFFGKIRPNKGVDVLIKAANILGKKYQNEFSVTIAGDAQNWEEYDDLIEDGSLFNLEIGFVSNQRIVELFMCSDYLVLPYNDMTQSGVIMVAYNYNVPVIASNLEEFRSYIIDGKNGFLFETGGVVDLVKIMEKIILNKIDILTIRENLRFFVEREISAKAISEKYSGFFDKIIKEI